MPSKRATRWKLMLTLLIQHSKMIERLFREIEKLKEKEEERSHE